MRPENRPGGRERPTFIEQARRAQILAAASRTVADVGYAHASLARIAAEAGVSKSVISYHFAGKDELLVRLVTEFFEATWDHMAGQLSAQPTAMGKIRAWIRGQLDYFGQHRTRFLAMAEIVAHHRAPDGSRPFAGDEAEELDALTEILEEGQRGGEFRDFDARSVAAIVIQCTEGVLGRWALDDGVDLEKQAADLVDFIDHAIRRSRP